MELFDAARIDGAGEFTILRRIAIPLAHPVIVTVTLLTFIGPWNEFLWPFLVTKDDDMQPLAVSLANYISNLASRAANPFGAILAGACVLAAPVIGLFISLPAPLHLERHRLRRQGLMRDGRRRHPVPLDAHRHGHVTRARRAVGGRGGPQPGRRAHA